MAIAALVTVQGCGYTANERATLPAAVNNSHRELVVNLWSVDSGPDCDDPAPLEFEARSFVGPRLLSVRPFSATSLVAESYPDTEPRCGVALLASSGLRPVLVAWRSESDGSFGNDDRAGKVYFESFGGEWLVAAGPQVELSLWDADLP